MTAILIGLALVFLDLDLTLASGVMIDVLPDVLGYIIALFGLRRMGAVSYEFSKCVRLCIAAGFASGVVLGMRLFPSASMVMVLMELTELIMQLCMVYFITKGVRDAELECSVDLFGKWLRWIWVLLALTTLLTYVLELVGVFQDNSMLNKVSGYAAMASDIAGIGFLCMGYMCKVRMDEEDV